MIDKETKQIINELRERIAYLEGYIERDIQLKKSKMVDLLPLDITTGIAFTCE